MLLSKYRNEREEGIHLGGSVLTSTSNPFAAMTGCQRSYDAYQLSKDAARADKDQGLDVSF